MKDPRRLEEAAADLARQLTGDPSSSMAGFVYQYLTEIPCDCELGGTERRVLLAARKVRLALAGTRETIGYRLRHHREYRMTDELREKLTDSEQEMTIMLRQLRALIKQLQVIVDAGELK